MTFSLDDRKPAIFRGLIAFEYIRAIAQDIHAMDRFMMANSTPHNLCWLAPMLDVLGTETDWNPGGSWRPMSDGELLYRRALCKGKPYCFLMNTEFENFSHEPVERYMKRCLAYGMFPGFFSHNASQGHYFTRPELYERDRDLFKKYVPLCKLVAEAGWEPITLARSDNAGVYVERYGDRYLTVFNDTDQRQDVSITVEMSATGRSLGTRQRTGGRSPGRQDRAVARFGGCGRSPDARSLTADGKNGYYRAALKFEAWSLSRQAPFVERWRQHTSSFENQPSKRGLA